MYCLVMLSTIGEYKSAVSWDTGYIEVERGNRPIYAVVSKRPAVGIYRVLNSLQEVVRGLVGTKLTLRTCDDWTAYVEPEITGAGWLVDYGLRAVVGARCLEGLCVLARRCISRDISYIDHRDYDGQLLSAALGFDLSDF